MLQSSTAQAFLFNTVVEQKIYGDQAVLAAVHQHMEHLENRLSFFCAESDIARINASAGKGAVPISESAMMVLLAAKKYCRQLGGKLDITLGCVIDVWRRCGAAGQMPEPALIENALTKVDINSLRLNRESMTARLELPGSKVDLGGIAKGYIADSCVDLYKSLGIESAFINLGGNVKTIGTKPNGELWQIGLQHPDQPRGHCFAALALGSGSVVTSGGYERSYIRGNSSSHHIIDPETGYPAITDLKSVTIIDTYSIVADACATAIFIQGLIPGLQQIQALGLDAVLVSTDNHIYISRRIAGIFQLLAEEFQNKVIII